MPARTLNENKLGALRLTAIKYVRLQHNFIRAPELVKVIDLHTAEVDLQSREHVRQAHAQKLNLLAVNLVLDSWRGNVKSRAHALHFGTLISLCDYPFCQSVKLLVGVTRHILQLH